MTARRPAAQGRFRRVRSELTTVNGNPGLILRLDGVIDGVLAFRVESARVTGLYYVRNPEKLTRVESENPSRLPLTCINFIRYRIE
ncbi:hypothetical protein [Nonomuraea sp. NPDC003201]